MAKKDKLLASAQKSLQKGQLGKAIKDYEKILQADPKDIRSRQKLAEILGRDKRIAEALEEYETVANHYSGGGFYLKAIAVYKQMQKLDGGQADYYHHLAELNEKQGLVGNALAEYRNLVAHYEKQEMFSEALGVLRKMQGLEPENLNVLVKIAETCARLGDDEEARNEFDAALAMLRGKGDYGRVLKLYEIFLPLYPDDADMKIGLAQALVARGDAEKGIQLLQGLLKDHPEHPGVLRSLADGYRKTENYESERLTYLHLLRHHPNDLELREGFIRAALDAGEDQRAREEIDEWQESFHSAGKSAVLQGFLHRLDHGETSGAEPPLPEPSDVDGSDTPQPDGPRFPSAEETDADLEESDHGGTELTLDDSLLQDPDFPADEEPVAETEELEEIPLEFLESVEQDPGMDVPAETSAEVAPEPEPAPEPEEPERVATDQEDVLEDVELELELDMDEVDGFEFDLNDRSEAAEPFDPEDADESDESDPPKELEEIEELEELEEAEELEELEELEDFEGGEELEELEEVDEPEELKEVVDGEDMADFAVSMEDLLPPEAETATGTDTRAELEEAEFYLQQGLLDDAERICRNLMEGGAESAEISAKMDQITELRKQAAAPAAMEGLFDLAGEIGDDGFPGLDEDRIDFADSQKGVETEIDGEDTESHYNLGIAYKEMGLLEDAVTEFDKAMKNPARKIDCLNLKGACLVESGAYEQGEEVFKAALNEELNDSERISLHYELGLLYEGWGRPLEALDSFQYVADADLFFRDVGGKIAVLRKELGMEGDDDEEAGGKGSKNRVSYV